MNESVKLMSWKYTNKESKTISHLKRENTMTKRKDKETNLTCMSLLFVEREMQKSNLSYNVRRSK